MLLKGKPIICGKALDSLTIKETLGEGKFVGLSGGWVMNEMKVGCLQFVGFCWRALD